MATTTPGSTLGAPTAGGTNTQGLADWAAPYVTGYLGQAQALGNQDYQTYKGPLTAGASDLQSNVFQGLGSLQFPSNLGQSFSSSGAYQPPNMATMGAGSGSSGTTQPQGPTGIAANYMNPYLQSVLTPQLQELRRQNDITQQNTNAKMTAQGAFGGGRNAIMGAQNNADMMREMNKTVGQGYASAYDKGMGQFNTEQGQAKSLADMMAQQGGVQRGIESEGVAADLSEFNQQRQYPYQQVQFQRDMISGLPMSSVTNTPAQATAFGNILQSVGGITQLMSLAGTKNLDELLSKFGLGSSSGATQ
jgi:hypothetical protein